MYPWTVGNAQAPELAALIRSVSKFKNELPQLDHWLPFPQNACCYSFGKDRRPLPIGALFLLWEKWPASTGTCPTCNGAVYGYAFGGFLSLGGVCACCAGCEKGLHRSVGGLLTIGKQIEPILKTTSYFLKGALFGGSFEGPRAPLVKALRQLGATDLPKEGWEEGCDPCAVSLTVTLPQQ